MEKKIVKKKLVLKKSIKVFFSKLLLTIIVFLVGMILVKQDTKIKNLIIDIVYEKSIKFTKAKSLYQKYFGNILSIDKIVKEEEPVFNEKLTYSKKNVYKDGVVLQVSKNYMVPVLESGIVIFMGEKDDYGSTVIVEQIDGVDVFYSNITAVDIKMYDYVEKGQLLGECKSDQLYLVFQKDGKYLDYKDYI